MESTSIILITYKSENIIYSFLDQVPRNFPVVIVDNSNNFQLKENAEKKYSNVQVFLNENNGVSKALNFAVSKINTKYFLQISPDVKFNFDDLKIFLDLAKILNDKFSAIGPRFKGIKEKSHKQISKNKNYDEINSIHGSCMFINKDCFKKIGGFDDNIFLYFEETDYCYRGKLLKYKSFQTNKSIVYTEGRSVQININNKQNITNLLLWHFIWSKFYFYKKKYGRNLSIIIFIPTLIRILLRLFFYKMINNKQQLSKYKIRLNGLLSSIKGEKSYLRP